MYRPWGAQEVEDRTHTEGPELVSYSIKVTLFSEKGLQGVSDEIQMHCSVGSSALHALHALHVAA